MHDFNENNFIEEISMTSRPNSLRALEHRRTRVLLAVVAVLAAILISGVTDSDQSEMAMGSPAMADSVSPATVVMPPARDARVFHQALPLYHWHTQCLLASSKSLRTKGQSTPARRSFMSRAQAEKRALLPCVYCADLD